MSEKENIKKFILSQIDERNIENMDDLNNWVMKMSSAVIEKRLSDLESKVNELCKK
ncbi:MAG: hypothetical protein LBE13_04420 [Bacteroidales bacterium]|jgi:hypothetical protein|nr:hypothetical protein [Bacteroidales bacterium]